MIRFVACLLLCGLAAGQRRDINYEDCGSKAKVLSAQIEPCDSDPCVMKRGTKPKVYFTVTSDQDTATAKLDAKISVFGVELPVPGLENDLCKNMVECPISKGQTYSGVMEVFVPEFAPVMKTYVSLKVLGDDGVSVCAKTPVLIE
ncbi:mite group 2 allergen-like Ixo r 2 [Rhipicephalus sanguineus]|uniref:mite group 2 allergen-like Ixo r 2 n=1 Tax=Rhipicephalus sanguineus TaxID=34632 RepID=UPI00189380F0|nr:mite group 2 allergen-like Ixo r 2 [Rhipicephalus sanguineus]